MRLNWLCIDSCSYKLVVYEFSVALLADGRVS